MSHVKLSIPAENFRRPLKIKIKFFKGVRNSNSAICTLRTADGTPDGGHPSGTLKTKRNCHFVGRARVRGLPAEGPNLIMLARRAQSSRSSSSKSEKSSTNSTLPSCSSSSSISSASRSSSSRALLYLFLNRKIINVAVRPLLQPLQQRAFVRILDLLLVWNFTKSEILGNRSVFRVRSVAACGPSFVAPLRSRNLAGAHTRVVAASLSALNRAEQQISKQKNCAGVKLIYTWGPHMGATRNVLKAASHTRLKRLAFRRSG